MRFRPTLRDLTAGVLVTVAVLIWSIWLSRELRRPRPVAVVPPLPASAPKIPEAPPKELPPPLERRAPEGSALTAAVESIRVELKKNPADSAALVRMAGFRGEATGDALLEFTTAAHSKEVRVEAIRLLSACGFTEEQLRKLMNIYDAEADDEIQASILLGVQKSPLPAAGLFIRKGVLDPNEAVRGVALSGLDPAIEADRSVLIGLTASDPSEQVRGSAAIQLQEQIGEGGVVEALLAMSLQDSSAENRMHAVGALRHASLRSDARVLTHLERVATHDRSADVRGKAHAVLAGLTGKND